MCWFGKKRETKKSPNSTTRDWLDSKAPCRLWSELKFSLSRNCCCACVGNNFGCKCSFPSKEMLFSDLDEREKKEKPKTKQPNLFSPDLGKHHLWCCSLTFDRRFSFECANWMFSFLLNTLTDLSLRKWSTLMISKEKGCHFIHFRAEWVKVKNTLWSLFTFLTRRLLIALKLSHNRMNWSTKTWAPCKQHTLHTLMCTLTWLNWLHQIWLVPRSTYQISVDEFISMIVNLLVQDFNWQLLLWRLCDITTKTWG